MEIVGQWFAHQVKKIGSRLQRFQHFGALSWFGKIEINAPLNTIVIIIVWIAWKSSLHYKNDMLPKKCANPVWNNLQVSEINDVTFPTPCISQTKKQIYITHFELYKARWRSSVLGESAVHCKLFWCIFGRPYTFIIIIIGIRLSGLTMEYILGEWWWM